MNRLLKWLGWRKDDRVVYKMKIPRILHEEMSKWVPAKAESMQELVQKFMRIGMLLIEIEARGEDEVFIREADGTETKLLFDRPMTPGDEA